MDVTCENMMTSSDHYQRINNNVVIWGISFQKIFLRLTKKIIKPGKIKKLIQFSYESWIIAY